MLAGQRVLNMLKTGEKVIASAYGLDDVDRKSIWYKAAGDAKFFRRITAEDATVTARKMDEVTCWMAFYWPKDVEWPKDGWWRPTVEEAYAWVNTLPTDRLIRKIRLAPPRRPMAASSKASKKSARARRVMETARARAV